MGTMLDTVLFSLLFMFLFLHGQSKTDKSPCVEKEKSLGELDYAKDALEKAKNLYPDCNDGNDHLNKSLCGKKEKSLGHIEIALDLIAKAKDNYPTCPPPEHHKLLLKPMDCSDVLKTGQNVSGVYTIWPRSRESGHRSLEVFCDMDTDGGGWTVIQRRGNFTSQEDFNRDWIDYKNGFGNINRDFWIGNDNIFYLSNQGPYSVRFDMQDVDRNRKFSVYNVFWIEDEKSNYKLHIENYSGNAGNSMGYHNDMMFSTKDKKNDEHTESCAKQRECGWWFKACNRCNPNGLYKPGINDDRSLNWIDWKFQVGLAAIDVKLRPM